MIETSPKPRLLISTDIETLGLVAGLHPMISIGAVAITLDSVIVDMFEVNLTVPTDLEEDPATVAWWKDKPAAWERSTRNALPPAVAMTRWFAWLDMLRVFYDLEFLAKPSLFDFSFINYYGARFCNRSTLHKSCNLDLYNIILAITGGSSNEAGIHNLPESLWADLDKGIAHSALDDATYQGKVAVRCLKVLESWRVNNYKRVRPEPL